MKCDYCGITAPADLCKIVKKNKKLKNGYILEKQKVMCPVCYEKVLEEKEK